MSPIGRRRSASPTFRRARQLNEFGPFGFVDINLICGGGASRAIDIDQPSAQFRLRQPIGGNRHQGEQGQERDRDLIGSPQGSIRRWFSRFFDAAMAERLTLKNPRNAMPAGVDELAAKGLLSLVVQPSEIRPIGNGSGKLPAIFSDCYGRADAEGIIELNFGSKQFRFE